MIVFCLHIKLRSHRRNLCSDWNFSKCGTILLFHMWIFHKQLGFFQTQDKHFCTSNVHISQFIRSCFLFFFSHVDLNFHTFHRFNCYVSAPRSEEAQDHVPDWTDCRTIFGSSVCQTIKSNFGFCLVVISDVICCVVWSNCVFCYLCEQVYILGLIQISEELQNVFEN